MAVPAELVELSEALVERISKIPGVVAKIKDHDLREFWPVIIVRTTKYIDREYKICDVIFRDKIEIRRPVPSDDTTPQQYQRKRKSPKSVIFEYANPDSINGVMKHIFKIAKNKIGSLKGVFVSSINFHKGQIEKEQNYIDKSKQRLGITTDTHEQLKSYKLEEQDG
jgi:hypothetical protein